MIIIVCPAVLVALVLWLLGLFDLILLVGLGCDCLASVSTLQI